MLRPRGYRSMSFMVFKRRVHANCPHFLVLYSIAFRVFICVSQRFLKIAVHDFMVEPIRARNRSCRVLVLLYHTVCSFMFSACVAGKPFRRWVYLFAFRTLYHSFTHTSTNPFRPPRLRSPDISLWNPLFNPHVLHTNFISYNHRIGTKSLICFPFYFLLFV